MNDDIEGLHHIAIICSAKEKALDFYSALGFNVVASHVRPDRHDEIIKMSGHGIVLELFIDKMHPPRPTNPEAYGLRHIALKVKNIDNIVSLLRKSGYVAEPIRRDTFTEERMTFVKDPDGLPIELHE
jgi:glyoxylase I family protein